MHDRIIVAKLNRSAYYQGERPETRFGPGDQHFERFNFRLSEGDRFYGSIPRQAPEETRKERDGWLVVFIALDEYNAGHYAVGWYESAVFENTPKPHPEDKTGALGITYTLSTDRAYLLPPLIRRHFKPPSMDHFESTTYIYARGPGADAALWRQNLADFAERVAAGQC